MASNGDVYVVLGASGGIGAPLVRRLTASGAKVVGLARDSARLDNLCADIGPGFVPVVGDAREADAVGAAVQRARDLAAEVGGALRGAACLVGSILLKPAHTTSPAELTEVLAQNLFPAFHLVRAAAPALQGSGGGALTLMSSAAARHGLANHEAIAAAKAAIEGLVRSAAATYAPRGVRVNAVAPGLVRTPLAARLTGNPASLAASEAMHPLGRIGEPDDVAALVAWTLGPEATWVTGQVFGMDGGLSSVAGRAR